MLYLLALFQLVAGPLVLGVIFTFAKVTVREAPQQGIAKAVQSAWQNPEVQTAFQALTQESQETSKQSLPKATKDKVKIMGVAWASASFVLVDLAPSKAEVRARAWTPAWPQAPPGTPPRLG